MKKVEAMTELAGAGGALCFRQRRRPKCGAPQSNCVRRTRSELTVAIFLGILFVTIIVGFVTPAKSEEPGKGWLTIWVLAGAVGDNYWVYINGHIVSAPPRKKEPLENIQVDGTLDGKLHIYYEDGGRSLTTIYSDQQFTTNTRSYIDRFLNPTSGDASHLFYPVNLRLASGEYEVEVAYLSHLHWSHFGNNSFPFVTTKTHIAKVSTGQRTQTFVTVSTEWSTLSSGALGPTSACGSDDGRPNLDYVSKRLKDFTNDPGVQALRGQDISSLSRPIVAVNLQVPQGGVREFDSTQIKYIANEILANYGDLPNHAGVADCKKKHPQFSKAYHEYDKLISDFEKQLEIFHTIAEK
jgi:hypothetical protein